MTLIQETIKRQNEYFKLGQTKSIEFRLKQLVILKKAIEKYSEEILTAVKKDLSKPRFEAYLSEIAFTIAEIDISLKKLKSWSKPKKVKTPLAHQPGSSYIYSEPYGVTLIIGPWNYPFHLTVAPLIGAISAGNCAVLKPSELTPNTSKITAKLFKEYFDPEYISVVEGGVVEAENLLNEKWDYIFFTGGTIVGQKVMLAAAKHLIPVTLELGGKSPCIVDKNVSIEVAARRVTWGKFFNAGQTCVAPDYVLVHKDIKEEFIKNLIKTIKSFYGDDPALSADFARIVNEHHFNRLTGLLNNSRILIGGQTNKSVKYIAPTVIDQIDANHPLMQEEIFGPIMPIIEYEDLDKVINTINKKPKPLSLYFFSNDKKLQEKIIKNSVSGGVCINDTLSHILPNYLPFGGVGESGMGNYHGKASFTTFSHQKSVLKKSMIFDPKNRYAPYKLSLQKIKKLINFMTS